MRITFLLPHYPWKPVGGFRVAYEYANRLAKRGHRVTVMHARALLDGRTRRRPMPFPRLVRAAERLRDALRKPRIYWQEFDPSVVVRYGHGFGADDVPDADVCVATAWQTAEAVARLPPGKGRPLYLIQHYETWSGSPEDIDATWAALPDKVVIAGWLARLAIAKGADPGRVHLIPNGIDHATYRVVRSTHGRAPRVAMMYSRHAWKRAQDGIDAIVLAKGRLPALEAVLFGAPARPDGLPDWIEYRQGLPTARLVDEVYNRAAVYLCSSGAEGWHLPPAEAMACGCAVVSTDIDGVRDYAVQGQTAILAPVGDVEALAAALEGLLRDERRRLELVAAGLAMVQRFDWDRSADLFQAVLQSLVARRSP